MNVRLPGRGPNPGLRAAALWLALGLGLSSAQSGAPPPAPQPLPPAQEQRAVAIQKNLRCPLCDTGESIAESRSDISVKMRESVREKIFF